MSGLFSGNSKKSWAGAAASAAKNNSLSPAASPQADMAKRRKTNQTLLGSADKLGV